MSTALSWTELRSARRDLAALLAFRASALTRRVPPPAAPGGRVRPAADDRGGRGAGVRRRGAARRARRLVPGAAPCAVPGVPGPGGLHGGGLGRWARGGAARPGGRVPGLDDHGPPRCPAPGPAEHRLGAAGVDPAGDHVLRPGSGPDLGLPAARAAVGAGRRPRSPRWSAGSPREYAAARTASCSSGSWWRSWRWQRVCSWSAATSLRLLDRSPTRGVLRQCSPSGTASWGLLARRRAGAHGTRARGRRPRRPPGPLGAAPTDARGATPRVGPLPRPAVGGLGLPDDAAHRPSRRLALGPAAPRDPGARPDARCGRGRRATCSGRC